MNDAEKILLAKAIANFTHREIIENAHHKYQISQSDMEEMNRQAVNRAYALVEVLNHETATRVFAEMYGMTVRNEWDDPVSTEETKKILRIIGNSVRLLESNEIKLS